MNKKNFRLLRDGVPVAHGVSVGQHNGKIKVRLAPSYVLDMSIDEANELANNLWEIADIAAMNQIHHGKLTFGQAAALLGYEYKEFEDLKVRWGLTK